MFADLLCFIINCSYSCGHYFTSWVVIYFGGHCTSCVRLLILTWLTHKSSGIFKSKSCNSFMVLNNMFTDVIILLFSPFLRENEFIGKLNSRTNFDDTGDGSIDFLVMDVVIIIPYIIYSGIIFSNSSCRSLMTKAVFKSVSTKNFLLKHNLFHDVIKVQRRQWLNWQLSFYSFVLRWWNWSV